MTSIKSLAKQFVWRQRNKHNLTMAVGKEFPLSRVEVGRWTYGPIHVISFGGPEEFLKIGSCCSIADGVTFLLGGGHVLDRVSTYPFRAKVLHSPSPHSIGPTIIDDDVWIGYGATVLGGVHIGQGAVVGARALVTKDVPPYAVVGGVPARLIHYRFNDSVREKLLDLDFSKANEEFIKNHIAMLEDELTEEAVDALLEELS